ncbi:gpW family head-tail joining protein [Neoaquamicrobium sediminum]|uniref:gpW family head-tail joining protein n=1 Tax=Neoaquamicrobium sediminum TaxID=1849104 RepID=UPI001565E794|nr:gpW family head-tail joining protein [Mesorhizobium sediminum]NRC54115.1 phage tail protein [Mesorhizobium sediminum]
MATTAELQARLAEAEKAYHEIATGGGVRTLVDQSGERIEYQPASLSRLQAYILDLKRQLGILPRHAGPLGFYFS